MDEAVKEWDKLKGTEGTPASNAKFTKSREISPIESKMGGMSVLIQKKAHHQGGQEEEESAP